ncbi:hypothetical protein IPM09_03980 [Candidatus Saccharibacteria bacterium]|nr:MAG: hypothetical protein IPM09_03980 [Candidatus Saccharibacteria bacterium]
MNNWALYPVIVGTIFSMILWIKFVLDEHEKGSRLTLSELATQKNLRYFRTVLWLCGPLFALSTLYYIGPRIGNGYVTLLLITIVELELLVGVVPPRRSYERLAHSIIAYLMGFLMLVATCVFAIVLPRYQLAEAIIGGIMLVVILYGWMRRRDFIYFEITYIFLSHISFVVAALAVTV